MATLFRALGWPETAESDENHRKFQQTRVVIALYGVTHYEANFGSVAEGFRGLTLSVNLSSFAECLAVNSTPTEIDGVELLEEPSEQLWGGGFSWRDPEGNIWDVAWAKGTVIDERGGVTVP